LNKYFMVFI